MDHEDTLRQIVAGFLDLEPGQLTSDVSFIGSRISGSLARTRLYAAIQHGLGVRCQAVYSARNYGELCNAVCGSQEADSSIAPLESVPNGAENEPPFYAEIRTVPDLTCGIDIEMVADLPSAKDHWKDPFYTSTFSTGEIAYCLMQANPPMHFAARWCAKEALKKCDPAYQRIDLKHIEVALTPAGAPFLQFTVDEVASRLPVAVSLSHTAQMAAAMVVKLLSTGMSEATSSRPVASSRRTTPSLRTTYRQ